MRQPPVGKTALVGKTRTPTFSLGEHRLRRSSRRGVGVFRGQLRLLLLVLPGALQLALGAHGGVAEAVLLPVCEAECLWILFDGANEMRRDPACIVRRVGVKYPTAIMGHV